MRELKRLLAVNLNYLGDALFTTPALSALRTRFPLAEIDVLAGERAAAILEGNPAIDRLLLRAPRGGGSRALSLFRALRAGRYDAVVLFQSMFSTATVSLLAGVPVRVGFAQDGAAPFLTHRVAPRRADEHVVAAYMRLALPFGPLPPFPHGLRVSLSDEDRRFAEQFWRDQELIAPVAGLVIGATRPQKCWPEEYFAALADKLWSAAGIASVLLGGPAEIEAAGRILAHARSPLVSAVGGTTEKQLAALIARSDMVISGDSGPLHIATALHTPTIAIFGSTDPAETGPWVGDDVTYRSTTLYEARFCAPCRKAPTCAGRFDCLRTITPERVFDAGMAVMGVATRKALPVISGRQAG